MTALLLVLAIVAVAAIAMRMAGEEDREHSRTRHPSAAERRLRDELRRQP